MPAAAAVSTGQQREIETLQASLATLQRNMAQQRAEFEAAVHAERRKAQMAQAAMRDALWTADYYAELYGTDAVQSITTQTHWPIRFYEFPHVPGTYWFNCGLAHAAGVDWLVTRRLRMSPESQVNDIQFWRLPPDGGVKLDEHIDVTLPTQTPQDNFEDPRCFRMGRELWLSCCKFRPMVGAFAHQMLARLDPQFQPVETISPVIGNNGRSVGENVGHEKNWCWFEHENEMHLVYIMAPEHKVVRTANAAPVQRFIEPLNNPVWHHGLPRSGTPPVRVEGEYFAFFHSATAWTKRQRRYHMGAYAFEAKRPFRPTSMSTIPLLSGSEHDPRRLGMPLVVFPNGALLRDGQWTVTLGVNDCACAAVTIPHAELLDTLKRL